MDTAQQYKELIQDIALERTHAEYQKALEKGIAESLKEENYEQLNRIFYQDTAAALLPGTNGGYDHSGRFWELLDAMACMEDTVISRILPEESELASNGYPMYVHGTNLLLCLMYHDGQNQRYDQEKVIAGAEKFVNAKKPLWEKSVISFLLCLTEKNTEGMSKELQTVCESYGRQAIAKYKKLQCLNAYGLVVLAKRFLSEEEFAKIVLPKHQNFSTGYIKWRLERKEFVPELYYEYPEAVAGKAEILKTPVAVTKVHRPYLNADHPYMSAKEKKQWHLDAAAMEEAFIASLDDKRQEKDG